MERGPRVSGGDRVTVARLYEALLWLADADEGKPVIIAYGVPHLAAHLAAILNDECWDSRCKTKHTREPALCLLGRADVVLEHCRRKEATGDGLHAVRDSDGGS